jgi:hypothetical protein
MVDPLAAFFEQTVVNSVPPSPHKILYHYTNWPAAKGILSTRTFWSTAHDCTNDDKELRSADHIILEVAQDCLRDAVGAAIDVFRRFVANFDTMRLTDKRIIYLTCFCSSRDDQHMWKLYGRDSTGICLGIRILMDDRRPVHAQRVSFTADVIYSEQSLRYRLTKAFRKIAHALKGVRSTMQHLEGGLDALYRIAAIQSVIAKQHQWCDEHEVRHVTFARDSDGIKPLERTDATGRVIRYTPVEVRETGKLIALSEIIVGGRVDFKQTRETIVEELTVFGYLANMIEYPDISVSGCNH